MDFNALYKPRLLDTRYIILNRLKVLKEYLRTMLIYLIQISNKLEVPRVKEMCLYK